MKKREKKKKERKKKQWEFCYFNRNGIKKNMQFIGYGEIRHNLLRLCYRKCECMESACAIVKNGKLCIFLCIFDDKLAIHMWILEEYQLHEYDSLIYYTLNTMHFTSSTHLPTPTKFIRTRQIFRKKYGKFHMFFGWIFHFDCFRYWLHSIHMICWN